MMLLSVVLPKPGGPASRTWPITRWSATAARIRMSSWCLIADWPMNWSHVRACRASEVGVSMSAPCLFRSKVRLLGRYVDLVCPVAPVTLTRLQPHAVRRTPPTHGVLLARLPSVLHRARVGGGHLPEPPH